jgi:hypothetical protein
MTDFCHCRTTEPFCGDPSPRIVCTEPPGHVGRHHSLGFEVAWDAKAPDPTTRVYGYTLVELANVIAFALAKGYREDER